MTNEVVALLGVPIDDLTADETVERVFQMIEDYYRDSTPRQVATVNVDFLVNTLSLRHDQPRHPELLDILRRSDLVTADGMPIVWASSLLKSPLKQRVTGADLVPALARAAAEKGKSIYFLGGRQGIAEKAAEVLISHCPGLNIAGVSSPLIITEGEHMADSSDDDQTLIEMINDSDADILLVGFGNPKQEIWFQRNRKRLKVPVTIGVGGTYEFISSSVARAPKWMQTLGLEWIHRIIQEPKRLWKRYFIGLFKFTSMLFPLIIYYKYISIKEKVFSKKYPSIGSECKLLHDRWAGSIKVIKTPDRLDRDSIHTINKEIMEKLDTTSYIVLDFENTYSIDLFGMGFLIRLWGMCNKYKKLLYITGTNPRLITFFKLNRLWDLLKEISYKDFEIISRMINVKKDLPSFYFVTNSGSDYFRIEFHGRLDANYMSGFDITSITRYIGQKDCILDLGDLDFVDSSGLVFFIKLKKHLAIYKKVPVLCNVNENILQILKITKILDLFRIQSSSLPQKQNVMESFA